MRSKLSPPPPLDRFGENGGLKRARVSIDAIATNPSISHKILDQGADYLLAFKGNQPTLRAGVEAYFADAPEEVVEPPRNRQGTWPHRGTRHGFRCRRQLASERRRFPGELRMPGAASLIRVCSTAQTGNARRGDARYGIASGCPNTRTAAHAVVGAGLSKMRFTGSWTLSSKTICHGSKRDREPTTRPLSGTSPSTWYAPAGTKDRSKQGDSGKLSASAISRRSLAHSRVNPDLEPWQTKVWFLDGCFFSR